MLIRNLTGWPPARFQTTETKGSYAPVSAAGLELQSAYLVPSFGPRDATEVLILLTDARRDRSCFARFKLKSASTAIRMVKALAANRGKTLSEIGNLEIREDDLQPVAPR